MSLAVLRCRKCGARCKIIIMLEITGDDWFGVCDRCWRKIIGKER